MQTISSIDTFDFSFMTVSGFHQIEKNSKNNNNDRNLLLIDSKQRLVESAKGLKYSCLQHSS